CPPPGSGEAGGLANTATLESEGVTIDDAACASLPLIELDKSISDGPNPNGDGTWSLTYDLVVTNSGDAAGVYDLADRLQYGDGVEIVSAAVNDAPAGADLSPDWTGLGDPGSAENVITTGVTID